MIHSDWQECLIDISDDDDLSLEVDLGKPYEELEVYIPALTSANLTLYVSRTHGGTYSAVGSSVTVAAGTGSFFDTWILGGNQHIKIGASAGQEADRTFYVRGVRS